MLKKIPIEQTTEELQSCYRPTILDSNFQALPFNNLGDREFELLCYSLVKEEIKKGCYHEIAEIKDIALMQGVGERGRDCVLYGTNEVRGVIQCKKYSQRLTKPQILKELIKFALFAIKDTSILPSQNKFKYLIYVSNDFNGSALELIHDYKNKIQHEINTKEIEKYTLQVLNEYESFQIERLNPPFEKLYNLLVNIDVAGVNGTDLTSRVQDNEEVLRIFFNVRSIISVEENVKQIRELMNDFGMKLLTDNDLKSLQSRIGNIDPHERIRLGLVDFYGYSIDFFKSLKSNEYDKIMNLANSIYMILNDNLLDYATKKIIKTVEKEIDSVLLKFGKIHQYSTQLCVPYLLHRVMPNVVSFPNIDAIKPFVKIAKNSEELLDYLSKDFLAISESLLNGDYSVLDNNPTSMEQKIKLFNFYHKGLNNIKEVEEQLEKDMILIFPILIKIEESLNELFKREKTIIISDFLFMNDNQKIKEVFNTFKNIEPSS